MDSDSDISGNLYLYDREFDSSDSFPDDASVSSEEKLFIRDLQGIKNNNPGITELEGDGDNEFIRNITNEKWEEIGRDISNNTHLEDLHLDGALNDDKASFLFRGLTRSSSIKELAVYRCGFSAAGVRIMGPFLQNANNLQSLVLNFSNIQSEGFSNLIRALCDSPIEELWCTDCGVESIEIDIDNFPRHLTQLGLSDNNVNVDGCREITKLLHADSTLTHLILDGNNIDDECIAILVGSLQKNKSLVFLGLSRNDGTTKEGLSMLLKLVNDISSVKATLQSNHTLKGIDAIALHLQHSEEDKEIQRHINMATDINRNHVGNPEAAGRMKIIGTQLHSVNRAALAELQGVSQSVYSEINPLHLPEVLSLVARRHGRGELFLALKSSIAGVISVVNERQCILQRLAYYEAKTAEVRAELAQFDAAVRGRDAMHGGSEACSNKRPRIDEQ